MRGSGAVVGPAVGLALALALVPVGSAAQIEDRVREVDDGAVRFTYPVRPGVEICENGIRMDDRRMQWHFEDGRREAVDCSTGSAVVELRLREGRVTDVEVMRPGRGGARDFTDLGRVDPEEAADYLVSLAYRGATAQGAEDAIFPAMIADAARPWTALVEIARDRALDEDVRSQALFWLGQEAAAAVTDDISGVALDATEDQEVRNAAIFALSQRPPDESIPALMEVARAGDAAESRKTAMFWLAQSDDERVVRFFEDILLQRRR